MHISYFSSRIHFIELTSGFVVYSVECTMQSLWSPLSDSTMQSKGISNIFERILPKATKTTSPIHFVVHNCYGRNLSTCTNYGSKKSGTFETDIYLKWCVLELDRMDVWERDDQMIPLGCYFSTINKFLGWNVQKGTNYMCPTTKKTVEATRANF